MKKSEVSFWDRPFVRGFCLALIVVPLIIFELIVRSNTGMPHTAENSLWYLYAVIILFAFIIPNYERLIRWQLRWMRIGYRNAENLEVRPFVLKIGKAFLYFFYVLFVAMAVMLRMLLSNG
ncbi:MAG: hypothetical protein WC292_02965 [Clostridia bacterium]